MATTITLTRDSLKAEEPYTSLDDNGKYQHHVTVRLSQGMGMLVEVGSNQPGTYTISNSISNDAAKILARWMLDNL